MSLAGKRSSFGDEYQLTVALHWLVQLLTDTSIQAIQVESLGIPGYDHVIAVDDVVILYKDGRKRFIQAKKNQPQFKAWSLSDASLRNELKKAYKQTSGDHQATVCFYSRTPFGELAKLVEEHRFFPDHRALVREKQKTLKELRAKLADILKASEEEALQFLRQIKIGPYLDIEDWNQKSRSLLEATIPRTDLAIPVLRQLLSEHQINRAGPYLITREFVLTELDKVGLTPTPYRDEASILDAFRAASCIGRDWPRNIGGEQAERQATTEIIASLEDECKTILVTDKPGSGKTCVLLDVVDHIEAYTSWGLLFIKGEQFAEAQTAEEWVAQGLPEDIPGQCARLSAYRRVVVVIDSLDVLSLNRNHASLKLFLGLMDRLERLDRVSLVVACRDFDLNYVPRLRSRKWEKRILIGPFSFETEVQPLIEKWAIEVDDLGPDLSDLLCLPQNLRLFYRIKHQLPWQRISSYDLYERFLDEIVVNDPLLGSEAYTALLDMANHLIEQRSIRYPRPMFQASAELIQRLISQDVLVELRPGVLQFSHQTLADCLMVREALSRKQTLLDFILSQPPLPFIRPAIRAYFFFLRAHQPDQFSKQVWAVVSHDEVAYHIKRLLCESLAEIIPTDSDWPLIRRIFTQTPNLFRLLLHRVKTSAWFALLNTHWLGVATSTENTTNWLGLFASRLSTWMNTDPEKVLTLWLRALREEWDDMQRLCFRISVDLDDFEHWTQPEVETLIALLLDKMGKDDSSFLGKALSRWVTETNQGDNVLWRYICASLNIQDDSRHAFVRNLRCRPSEFYRKEFLDERLTASEELLSLALADVEKWSREHAWEWEQRAGLSTVFLDSTSWEQKHRRGMQHRGPNDFLFDSLERALVHHAQRNSSWWRQNEPELRKTQEEGLVYLLVTAYKAHVEANITGISALLTNTLLFRRSRLEHELGLLTNVAYPYLPADVQNVHQDIVLRLYDGETWDEDGKPLYAFRRQYDFFLWIPAPYRSPKTEAFIRHWEPHFGNARPEPRIWSSVGWGSSPIATDALLDLSDASIQLLLTLYSTPIDSSFTSERRAYDPDTLSRTLSAAAAHDPARFIQLFHEIRQQDIDYRYSLAIVDGISNHLLYRFGNLAEPQQWKPKLPLPSGAELGQLLLRPIQHYPFLKQADWTFSHALRACCHVLIGQEELEHILIELFGLLKAEDPTQEQERKQRDLASVAINSTRGIAAESAIILANRLLEEGQALPELLPYLLQLYSKDEALSVRLSIVRRLPYLLNKMPVLGWNLLETILTASHDELWIGADRCLYYNYYEHFDRVLPFLNRILVEGKEEAQETWGRIASLSHLAGHISQTELFRDLKNAEAEGRDGAVQVFLANIHDPESRPLCNAGLLHVLSRYETTETICFRVNLFLEEEENVHHISDKAVFAFLNAYTFRGHSRSNLEGLFKWISRKAGIHPLEALKFAEALLNKLSEDLEKTYFHTGKYLATALIEILREVDDLNDAWLINRAIRLQDGFLQLEIREIEKVLDQASIA